MTYNKAREEKLWIIKKNKEEELLRKLRVTEDIIQDLHRYDWELFKRERSFLEKQYTNNSVDDCLFASKFAKAHKLENRWHIANVKKELHEMMEHLHIDFENDICKSNQKDSSRNI